MKIKKIRNMTFEKQRNILMARKKRLKWVKIIRNSGIVSTFLTYPMYTEVLEDLFKKSNVYSLDEIIKYSIIMAALFGITSLAEGISNKYIVDCAQLKTIMEMSKIEKFEQIISRKSMDYDEDYGDMRRR